jgi:hypothetical protein
MCGDETSVTDQLTPAVFVSIKWWLCVACCGGVVVWMFLEQYCH